MGDGDTILLCADAAYLPAAVFVANQAVALGGAQSVHVYTDAAPDPAVTRLASDRVTFRIGDLGGQDWALDAKGYMSRAVYLRIVALEELGRTHRRILYLDCDLVLRPSLDLAALFALDLGGHPLAAVRSAMFWGWPKRSLRRYAMALDLPDWSKYLNSGVLLIDGAAWTGREIGARAARFNREHPELCRFNDQSAINHALRGDWLELSPRWNWSLGRAGARAAWEAVQPHVLHFNGPLKPWNDHARILGEGLTAPWRDWVIASGLERAEDRFAPLPADLAQERAQALVQEAAALEGFTQDCAAYLTRKDFAA